MAKPQNNPPPAKGGKHRRDSHTPAVKGVEFLTDHAKTRDQAKKDADDYKRDHPETADFVPVRTASVMLPLLPDLVAGPVALLAGQLAATVRINPDAAEPVPGGFEDSMPPSRPGGVPCFFTVAAVFLATVAVLFFASGIGGWLR